MSEDAKRKEAGVVSREDATKRVREDFLAVFQENIVLVVEEQDITTMDRVHGFPVFTGELPPSLADTLNRPWADRLYRVEWDLYRDSGFSGLKSMIGKRQFIVRSLPEIHKQTNIETLAREHYVSLRLAFPPGEWGDKTSIPAGDQRIAPMKAQAEAGLGAFPQVEGPVLPGTRATYWPLVIHLPLGSTIVFRGDGTPDEVMEFFYEAVEVALDAPQFVEALKARGAVVLQPGETLDGKATEPHAIR